MRTNPGCKPSRRQPGSPLPAPKEGPMTNEQLIIWIELLDQRIAIIEGIAHRERIGSIQKEIGALRKYLHWSKDRLQKIIEVN